jgi:predicted ATPase/Tfp pilus assembly protein PilF
MVQLYRGAFLAQFFLSDSDVFEEWASLKREWFHLHVVEALTILAHYYERRGNLARARAYMRQQVNLEPWREEAHRYLMQLLALEGQRSAALAQYKICCQALEKELNAAPTDETLALYRRIRDGEEVSRAQPQPNLPPPPTPFIGREDELKALAGYLVNPDCRLVTLVGPGGIGKTRLALQVAKAQVGMFNHGVYFLSLAATQSADLIPPAIAEALKFRLSGQQDPEEELLAYLHEKELLLVLDNVDHIINEVSPVLVNILQQAPYVILLVTSRERLNLQEEWIYEVGGLTFPETALDVGEDAARARHIYSAVDLFWHQAERLKHDWVTSEMASAPSKKELNAVVRICQLVEGMPLGIELAAAWIREQPCEAIARELEEYLTYDEGARVSSDILTTSLRNVPSRHRSMRASFEHSWRLLSAQEQQAFSELSVFQGGFTREAALAITTVSPTILTHLTHKSLLRSLRFPRTEAQSRYQTHSLLQQYAAQKLAKAPEREYLTRKQHAGYYATFLQARELALKGEGQADGKPGYLTISPLDEIRIEIGNVRRAWRWALGICASKFPTAEAVGPALRVLQQSVESLYLFYILQDWQQEGQIIFQEAVKALESPSSIFDADEVRAEFLSISNDIRLLVGRVLARQGKCYEYTDPERARILYERSLDIFHHLGDWRETALPLHGLGYIAHMKGDYTQAEEYLTKSLETYRRSADRWGEANALSSLCLVARRQGTFARAKQWGQESLAIRRTIGDQRGIASSLSNLGLVQCTLGEYAEAKVALEEALHIFRQMNYRVGISNVLNALCQATFGLGDLQTATKLAQESLAIYRDVGDAWGAAISLNNLGCMAMESGNLAKAQILYQEGIAIYRRIGIKSGLANTLSNLGEVCAMLGAHAEARHYLYEALEIANDIGATPILLEILTRLASLFAQAGHPRQALEILSVALQHSALIQSTRDKAMIVYENLQATLSPHVVVEIETQAERQTLKNIVAEVLEKHHRELS